MSTPRPAPISGTAITAIALGAVALLMVLILFPGAKLVGALVGVAALIVGGLGAVNARRAGGPWIAPAAGATLGAIAVIAMIIYAIFLT